MQMNLNVDAVRETAHLGVRRASSFLALGLKAIEGGPPKSAKLGQHFQILFMPEPLPPEVAENLANDYRAWLVGAALKELDTFLSLALDLAWDIIRIGELHGKPAPTEFGPDANFQNKGTAKKLDIISTTINAEAPWAEYFPAFGLARNCLSHGAGIVRERDTTSDSALIIRWRSPTIIIVDGDKERLFDMRNPPSTEPTENEARVLFRMAEREARYEVGQPLILSADDLTEICLCYQATGDAVSASLVKYLKQLGIAEAAASTP